MGALDGIRIVEMAGIGPGPFAGMMMADHGASVLRVERLGGTPLPGGLDPSRDLMTRGRPVVQVDLKSAAGRDFVVTLAGGADGLIEGYRPGVMERLGLGPEVLLAANPALVYGRMTGWGQDGPKAHLPGHDINYLALSGTLDLLGRPDAPPHAPANLLGDYGGGGLLLAFGLCAALLSARSTGAGQVVDCAMVDGAALLATLMWSLGAQGQWQASRGGNLLDGGAHFYDSYQTSDGRFLALGAIEPAFYAELRRLAGLDDPAFDAQFDPAAWPALKDRVARIIATRTRAEWCALLEDSDACVAPVLSMAEAPHHPHNRARQTFVTADGIVQPAPAPRFGATPAVPRARPPADPAAALRAFGIADERRAALIEAGVIATV